MGTGSFGTVYQGLYRSSDGDTPCAIKEAKNDTLRDQLLDEADRMRYEIVENLPLFKMCSIFLIF